MSITNVKSKKVLLGLITIALLAATLAAYLFFIRGDSSIGNDTNDLGQNQTTSTEPTAQASFNDGTADRGEAGNSVQEGEGTAVIVDTNGRSSVETNNVTTSSSGEITLFLAESNTPLKSGQEISGKSSLDKVSYRLIDSVSGVIAAGELNVVNGKFSGTLQFETTATEGRLDFFGTQPDGNEFSNVEIPVRFQ